MVARPGIQNRALVIALLASLLLWNLPFGGFVLYPFKLFATWAHELSHGLVMLLTGAGFDRMEIYQDTSGFAYSLGASGELGLALIASAGYVGTAVFGAWLLIVGQTRRGAKTALAVVAGVLLLSATLWVRNGFGLAVVLGFGAGLLATATMAEERLAGFLLNFVAAQMCINAVLDLRVLFRSNLVVNGEIMQRSDAHNMAAATFGTSWMWAAVWLAWSCALFYLALRRTHLAAAAARTSARSLQGSAST